MPRRPRGPLCPQCGLRPPAYELRVQTADGARTVRVCTYCQSGWQEFGAILSTRRLDALSDVVRPREDCSPEAFRLVIDELLAGPEPELDSIGAAEALRELRTDSRA